MVFIEKQEDRSRILFFGGKTYKEGNPEEEPIYEIMWDAADNGKLRGVRYK